MIYEKDPAEIKDYGFDWTDELRGDPIVTSTWTVTPSGLTQSNPAHNTTTTVLWLSGGTVGVEYHVVNQITTEGGRVEKDDHTIVIQTT